MKSPDPTPRAGPSEWLEVDGRGGFATGTSDGVRARRYHGLLLAALSPAGERTLLVADLEVYVETPNGNFALTSHRYRGDVIHPDGVSRLTEFTAEPWPTWQWTLPDDVRVTCELVIEPGGAYVVSRWTARGAGPLQLAVRPLLAARNYHALQREGSWWSHDVAVDGADVAWRPTGDVAIHARSSGNYAHQPGWYHHFVYATERDRGLDFEEDLACPGVFSFDLAAPALLAFGSERVPPQAFAVFDRERTRRATPELERAMDAYLIARANGPTVIAGYPWFSDWGRDTFIVLRSLCLARYRRDTARDILLAWAPRVSQGMMPNRYGEQDFAPEYGSVDAALWFVLAADAYVRSGSVADVDRRALDAAIDAIIDGYRAGTRYRIALADDGLVACGEPGVQLTWMDAKVGDAVITPRIGKPVEVQALWLNALEIAAQRRNDVRSIIERGRASFSARFWDPTRRQLHDVVDCDHVPNTVDASCRPNQLFALGALPVALIDGGRARAALDTCEHKLWTVAGPRTLAADEPQYCGHYGGGPAERDRCYHNGPVWPWLTGAFVDAWLRVRGNSASARQEAKTRFVEPLRARAVHGHVAEIFDGDSPHRAAAAPFQAWSVAELLRLVREFG